MLSTNNLQKLAEYSSQNDVVSLYLNLDPAEGDINLHKLRMRKLIDQISSKADKAAISNFYETKEDWLGRGMVVFSCAADHFFESYTMQIAMHDLLWAGKSPYIKPLTDLMDSFGYYGVVLLTRQSVRLLVFHLGEVLAGTELAGEQIKHVKHGGASTMPGRTSIGAGRTHYEDELEDRNMRTFVESAIRFFEQNDIKRILIGGIQDNVSLFQRLLPKQWQSNVYGTFSYQKTDDEMTILQKALEIGEQTERRREDELVAALLTAAATGKEGVVTLNETLDAIYSGQVQTLLLDKNFHAPAYQCKNCGFITAYKNVQECPYCEHAIIQIPDAIDMAVHRVIQDGGEVEIFADNPEMQKIGIGALLRYQILSN